MHGLKVFSSKGLTLDITIAICAYYLYSKTDDLGIEGNENHLHTVGLQLVDSAITETKLDFRSKGDRFLSFFKL